MLGSKILDISTSEYIQNIRGWTLTCPNWIKLPRL